MHSILNYHSKTSNKIILKNPIKLQDLQALFLLNNWNLKWFFGGKLHNLPYDENEIGKFIDASLCNIIPV